MHLVCVSEHRFASCVTKGYNHCLVRTVHVYLAVQKKIKKVHMQDLFNNWTTFKASTERIADKNNQILNTSKTSTWGRLRKGQVGAETYKCNVGVFRGHKVVPELWSWENFQAEFKGMKTYICGARTHLDTSVWWERWAGHFWILCKPHRLLVLTSDVSRNPLFL